MLPKQLKTRTNPLVALNTNTGLNAQELNEHNAGSYAVEDKDTDKDVVEAGGNCNSRLKQSTNKSEDTRVGLKSSMDLTRMKI